MHLDVFIKSRLGHLVKNNLQLTHRLLKASVFKSDCLVLALDIYFWEALRVIQILNRVHLGYQKHNYKIIAYYIQNLC